MSLKSATLAVALTAALAGAPAHAGILFQDNFDSDNAASVPNVNGLLNWTVSGGTIDYIRSGDSGINCFGGTGGCLDMDSFGRITSKQLFGFTPGVVYTIDLDLSGSQRGVDNYGVRFGFVEVTSGDERLLLRLRTPDAPFSTASVNIISSPPGSWRLFAEGIGGDDAGLILDNLVLRDDRAASVPEPATMLLFGLGLLAAGAARGRKVPCS